MLCHWQHAAAVPPTLPVVAPLRAGVRQQAQLRLNSCHVDCERLKSTGAQQNPQGASVSKDVRRLMRRMYGEPDQDYEDWQIVVMSDISGGHCCGSFAHVDVSVYRTSTVAMRR